MSVQAFKPDVVFHLAATTCSTVIKRGRYIQHKCNGNGQYFEAKNTPSVVSVVNVTTDKCYENNEWAWGYRERSNGGFDPYSSSKGCSELVTRPIETL